MQKSKSSWCIYCAFLICLLAISFQTPVRAEKSVPIIIEGGTLIDGNGGTPVENVSILIEGNKIKAISQKGKLDYPKNAKILQADGKFILPGLMDAHVHYSDWLAELSLVHGVTSVFDIGGAGPMQIARREAINRGALPGPRNFIAVTTLNGPVAPGRVIYGLEIMREPMSVRQAKAVVKRVIAANADLVNIQRGLSKEVWQATIEEAHKAGLPVVGQPLGPTVYAWEAIEAGVDILEHAAGIAYSIVKDPSKWQGYGKIEAHSIDPTPFADMDENKAADMIKLLVKKNVFLEANLIALGRGILSKNKEWEAGDKKLLANPDLAYIPAATKHKWFANYHEFDNLKPAELKKRKKGFRNMQRFIKQYAQAGGKVMTGTDTSRAGWALAGIGLHYEMELLREAGLTPMQIIMAATRNVAEGYRILDKLGTIEDGKLADLIIVNADPLKNIENMQKIEWVIKDGQIVDRTYNRSFKSLFTGFPVEAREWALAMKKVYSQGIPRSGLLDPSSAFGQPCPGIESIAPIMVSKGNPELTLTIRGFNFTSKSQVFYNNQPIPSQLIDATELKITINKNMISQIGTFPIIVKNPGPFFVQPQWGSTSNRANLLVSF